MILFLVVQMFLAILFLFSGSGKLLGWSSYKRSFEHLRLSKRIRILAGIVQLMGSIGLITGFWFSSATAASGLLLSFTMFAAIASHIRVKDTLVQTAPAIFVCMLTVLLLFI
ncbi:DoxX family protein [Cohnella sp. LGH]|uniref:DoxX family protein n=1 Tax=Cohnella sp. LGH TaxID=1619153 RepID=UPI001ADA3B78|nr:DoxX family protein [Cohnella sp. LGH]QTH40273.1 DoxX family protein [Cohnella sp. LGH]